MTLPTGAHRQGRTPTGGKAPLLRACGHAEWGTELTLLLPLKGREGVQRLGAWPQAQNAWKPGPKPVGCVALGKLLPLSLPRFPDLQRGVVRKMT